MTTVINYKRKYKESQVKLKNLKKELDFEFKLRNKELLDELRTISR